MGLSIGMLRQALSHLRLPRVGIVGLGWVILMLSGPACAAGPGASSMIARLRSQQPH